MKLLSLLFISTLIFTTQAYSHSGRTDSSGGHNCSQKSIDKGLCSGYHYHGGKLHDTNHNVVSRAHSDNMAASKEDVDSTRRLQKKTKAQS